MGRRSGSPYRQSGSTPSEVKLSLAQRWWGKALLLLLSVALLTFSFSPFKQFYFAWVALAPWLIVLRACRSARAAVVWSWLFGVVFFTVNMWWLAWVTGPGLIALMALLGMYWSVAGLVIYAGRLLGSGPTSHGAEARESAAPRPLAATASVFLIAAVWVTLEWVRGHWPLGGLAWLYLGHSQSPVLHLCQIADITGVYGISFWLALVNAWAALFALNRKHARSLVPAAAAIVIVLLVVVGYGFFRFSQKTTTLGPTVLLVQPNYPQSNSGAKGASYEQIISYHIKATEQALREHPGVDVVVWSETMMPPLNPEAAEYAQGLPSDFWRRQAALWQRADAELASLARRYNTTLLVGGECNTHWTINKDDIPYARDRRNSAYLYSPAGRSDLRYDKIHLVPFGEYLPFKTAFPPLYKLFLALSPYTEEFTLTAGPPDAMTVFPLRGGWRFVTPICYEDIDSELVRRMFRPDAPGAGKRTDFIINITNDGWFRFSEMPQHFQAAIFRSIENRVPTSRSVNTGISGFIDSMGSPSDLIAAGSEGVSVARIDPDRRLTFYTRFGDVFAYVCVAITVLLALMSVARWWLRPRSKEGNAQ